jgi:SAM-dependent methyltransferase
MGNFQQRGRSKMLMDRQGYSVNGYRRRIWREMRDLLSDLKMMTRILDVGAGDGWFAWSIERMGACDAVTAIDVMARPEPYHRVETYDGDLLPYPDDAYDLVYAVDVVHHADEPAKLLGEMARCTRRYLLLKDHTWLTKSGWLSLAARDEIGNRRFGVRCVYKYQRGWEWDVILQRSYLKRVKLIYPLNCHAGLLGYLANNSEFLSLWEKV